VPFELGRPLGVPGDSAFQTGVLRQALDLLERTSGPVLADYPEDAPALADAPTALVCPVNFAPPVALSNTDQLRVALQQEIGQLRTWYDLALSRRGRTTMGVSGLTPEELGTFIGAFLDGKAPPNPQPEIPLATLFRYAVEDLKAYYGEALSAQPGQRATDGKTVADWFWQETTAAQVLFAIQEVSKHSDVPGMQVVATSFLIPRTQSKMSPSPSA
jgi:D-proline reductase (dithiol) PrdB